MCFGTAHDLLPQAGRRMGVDIMKTELRVIIMIAVILVSFSVALAQEPQLKIQTLMNQQEFKSAGLNKLTPSELKALNHWLNTYTLHIIEFEKGSPIKARAITPFLACSPSFPESPGSSISK
jgi:hypothetical protein